MYVFNSDTGTWTSQLDSLSKDYYDNWKQDLQSVALYSRALSGATYLPVNDLNNIYDVLAYNKYGFFANMTYSVPTAPTDGPTYSIDGTTYDEFYNKYLNEYAFTIKNQFTPEKLIQDQLENYLYVDVATTGTMSNIGGYQPHLVIDGVRVLEGHRVLVKNEINTFDLNYLLDPNQYVTASNIYISATLSATASFSSTYSYYYYNDVNGIYKYTMNKLVKQTDLDDYTSAQRYSVVVRLGSNFDKQFHLERLPNGYFPVSGQNCEFGEKENWVLRNRVDYHNIFDINYYDILNHDSQSIVIDSVTYSIPSRTIAVGDFGMIINNQDKLAVGGGGSILSATISFGGSGSSYGLGDTFTVDGGTTVAVGLITGVDGLGGVTSFTFSDIGGGYEVGTMNTTSPLISGGGGLMIDILSVSPILAPTYSISHIMNNKFKVNLRSITQTNDYYWICGDEGTLLKVSKYDFSVEKIDLGETSNLTSVSFYGNLNGMVVGKFNTIYWTGDGGYNWNKLSLPDFDIYSYNKVVQYDFFQVYVGGETGIFIELNYTGGNWIAYKRKISKQLSSIDEYILVEDINDMFKTNWVGIPGLSYSVDQTSDDFAYCLVYDNRMLDYRTLEVTLNSKYFGTSTFSNSEFYLAFSIQNSSGIIYTNPHFISGGTSSFTTYDMWQVGTASYNYSATFSLPVDINGNLINDTYTIETRLIYNYDNIGSSILSGSYFDTAQSYSLQAKNGRMLLIATNNDNVILYDIDDVITTNSNQFIYCNFTQSHSDLKSIVRRTNSTDVYIAGDNIYKFDFRNFLNISDLTTNSSTGFSTQVGSLYLNKLFTTQNYLYLAGNQSVLDYYDYLSTFNDLDPSFDSRLKSKMLFLDYDIASKLNFWTSDYQYVLPNSITMSCSDLSTAAISFGFSEDNWWEYWADANKTFKYYTGIDASYEVQPQDYFKSSGTAYTMSFSNSGITNDFSIVSQILPSILSPTQSRYIGSGIITIPPSFGSTYPYFAYLHEDLIVFRWTSPLLPFTGDTLYFESDVVKCNLLVNRVETEGSDTYAYCYSEFNENIINGLLGSTQSWTLTDLNRFVNYSDFVNNFNKHPFGNGYKATTDGVIVTISPIFNNYTAYYNLRTTLYLYNGLGPVPYIMDYDSKFINFGYTPYYNIESYLYDINPTLFTSGKPFTILPSYNLPGNNSDDFTPDNVYYDVNLPSNKLLFGSHLKQQWESLLIWTFYDVISYTNTDSLTNTRMLIINKYYDSTSNGYAIEFHKIIEFPTLTILDAGIATFGLVSRNTLGQISEDLKLNNNIQRTSKTVYSASGSFDVLQNEINFKFSTESYLKALVSDYDIQKNVYSIVYTDNQNRLAMNVLNLDQQLIYNIISTDSYNDPSTGFFHKLQLTVDSPHQLSISDQIFVTFNGGTGSSAQLNHQYFGLQTVIYVISDTQFVTSIDYGTPYTSDIDSGTVVFTKKDPFFNYQPVDIFKLGSDHKVTQAIEIKPQSVTLVGSTYSLVDVDLTKFTYQLIDGLTLNDITTKYHWILEAEISNAVIGQDANGLVWYSGIWYSGRWFGGTWYSGIWVSGDWYGGNWYSYDTTFQYIKSIVNKSYINNLASRWLNGRWFDGTWNAGTWYMGRRYAGDWISGNWYNGIWNDGHWFSGNFEGGIWVRGTWEKGIFNCNVKPAYWIDGVFNSGDFENGIWYNGQFGANSSQTSRFGIKSTNTRTSTWNGGNWLSGQFHSYLNYDTQTGQILPSTIHKYSIWKTGNWFNGDFYGGIAYNMSFLGGKWHGGILEEIQVSGVSPIYPAITSPNQIILNGIFRFNIGDNIWVIDDFTGGSFSYLGSNDNPRNYRINNVYVDSSQSQTHLTLNYNLSTLGVPTSAGNLTWSNVETGLKVVSIFKDVTWNTGIWTNGIFDGGTFESGIWYNGVFLRGTWGH
jgi:hypothetical protein